MSVEPSVRYSEHYTVYQLAGEFRLVGHGIIQFSYCQLYRKSHSHYSSYVLGSCPSLAFLAASVNYGLYLDALL